jgi:hypothetical protein
MNMRRNSHFLPVIFLHFMLLIPFFSNGQIKVRRQKYWTAGFNAGMIGWSPSYLNNIGGTTNFFSRTGNYGFGSVIDEYGHKSLALLANTSIGVNGGFLWRDKKTKNYTAVQVELQNNKACYEFDSPFGFPTHGDTTQKWVEADKYIKYSVALQRSWYISQDQSISGGSNYFYVRESFGQTILHRNLGDPFAHLITLNHSEDWTENGTGMKSNVVAVNQSSWMLGTEMGYKYVSLNNKHSIDIGLVYYAPFTNSFTEEYEFFKQGISVGKSQITYNGGTVMCNLRYNFNYEIKGKPVDTTALKKEELAHSHKINGRHLDIQKTMEVSVDLITAKVWDRGKVDGDKISLYLNGELILEDFTLTKEKKEISLHLVSGHNYLVMHAVNLGTVPPNTASLEIDDNTKKKRSFSLVSDTKKSGAIEIIYKP